MKYFLVICKVILLETILCQYSSLILDKFFINEFIALVPEFFPFLKQIYLV